MYANKSLGKQPAKIAEHAPSLDKLMLKHFNIPASANWLTNLTGNPDFDNDNIGDCTLAAFGHFIRVWTQNCWGQQIVLSTNDITDLYFKLTGGEDTGLAETDVLNWWSQNSFAIPQQQAEFVISGWGTLRDTNQIKMAISAFGGAYIGLQMPISAQTQTKWDVVDKSLTGDSAPGSWGGHAVGLFAYNEQDLYTCISWGEQIQITQDFLNAYMDESHVILSPTWILTNELSPSDVNYEYLEECMKNYKA